MVIDKDKVMKSIECCLRPDNTNLCGECSYKNVAYDCKHALIKDVHELLKEQKAKAVLSERECETLPNHYERKGFCPKCHQVVEWYLNRSYCGFCGQELKWK